MKRMFLVVLAVVLVAGLIFSGCAKEPAGPGPGETFNLVIKPLFAGSSPYVVGNVLATWLNEESTWVKATCPESKGDVINVKELVNDPSQRENTIFFVAPLTYWAGEMGLEPMNEAPFNTFDYSEFKYLWYASYGSGLYATTDANIKTFYDLQGKKVHVNVEKYGSKAATMRKMFELAGLTIEEYYIATDDAASRMKDGAIDAMFMSLSLVNLPNHFADPGWAQEVLSTRDVYGISFPREVWDKLKAEWPNHPERLVEQAPYSVDDCQPETTMAITQHMAFACHESMSDKVVTEVLTILYGHVNELGEYANSQKVVTDKTMGAMGVPDKQIHPAALKFYRDRGMSTKDIVEFTKAEAGLE